MAVMYASKRKPGKKFTLEADLLPLNSAMQVQYFTN